MDINRIKEGHSWRDDYSTKHMLCPSCGHFTLLYDSKYRTWFCNDCHKEFRDKVGKDGKVIFTPVGPLKEKFVGKPEVGKSYYFSHNSKVLFGEFVRETGAFYIFSVDGKEVHANKWTNISTAKEDIVGVEDLVTKMEKDVKVPKYMRLPNRNLSEDTDNKSLKNILKDRATYHSKRQKGLSPFCSLGEGVTENTKNGDINMKLNEAQTYQYDEEALAQFFSEIPRDLEGAFEAFGYDLQTVHLKDLRSDFTKIFENILRRLRSLAGVCFDKYNENDLTNAYIDNGKNNGNFLAFTHYLIKQVTDEQWEEVETDDPCKYALENCKNDEFYLIRSYKGAQKVSAKKYVNNEMFGNRSHTVGIGSAQSVHHYSGKLVKDRAGNIGVIQSSYIYDSLNNAHNKTTLTESADTWMLIKTDKYYDPEGLDIEPQGKVLCRGTERECRNEFSKYVIKARQDSAREAERAKRNHHAPFVRLEKLDLYSLVICYPHAQAKDVYQLIPCNDAKSVDNEMSLNEDHMIQNYKGYELDWDRDGIDPDEGIADFTVYIRKNGKDITNKDGSILSFNGFREARKWIDSNMKECSVEEKMTQLDGMIERSGVRVHRKDSNHYSIKSYQSDLLMDIEISGDSWSIDYYEYSGELIDTLHGTGGVIGFLKQLADEWLIAEYEDEEIAPLLDPFDCSPICSVGTLHESKKKKPFDSINKNAGIVTHNIAMFNKANSPIDAPCNNPISGPMGGDVSCCEDLDSTTKVLGEKMRLNNGMREREEYYFDDGDYSYHFFDNANAFGKTDRFAILVIDYGFEFKYDQQYTDEKTGTIVIPTSLRHETPKQVCYFEFTEESHPDIFNAMIDDDIPAFRAAVKAETERQLKTSGGLTEAIVVDKKKDIPLDDNFDMFLRGI